MGLTTWWRGVYGGEYTPIGLRLFAWWKKNGERRLQKAGSGSMQIRSNQNCRRPSPFIGSQCLAVEARSKLLHHAHLPPPQSYRYNQSIALTGKLVDLYWPSCGQQAHAAGPLTEKATAIERARRQAPWSPRSSDRASQASWPPALLFFSFLLFSFIYFF
jgi:hypothetical protein